ncbi:4-carboxymuconolactone decarboxylase [Bacillus sp. FJAT-42376]|nr:4-carboxymuconolactone decarboxylase [Bacillus sp. FJAT-42376]
MNRAEKSRELFNQLFGKETFAENEADPDFYEIMNRFIYGDIFHHGSLSNDIRELITLVVLTVNHTVPQLKEHVSAAIKTGVTPAKIKEAVYHCAPYIGFPKTLDALEEINKAFKSLGIDLPVQSQVQTEETDRFDKGLDVQVKIFGDVIAQMHKSAPANQRHIQEYLSAFCFGDFYTRSGLDLKTRELLTLCIVTALGGADSQVKSHVQGNIHTGNDKETLIAAITHCLPYIGFPRTLNALACLNEVIPEKQRKEGNDDENSR